MNGLLVADPPGYETTQLLELIQDLKREVVSLRREVADLRRENLQLRQEAGYWKSMHAAALVRIAKLEAENEQLRGENRQLQARLFGQKSEQASSRDRSNHLPGEETDGESLLPRPRGQQKGRPGPPRRDYSHLPVVEELIELPADSRCCPQSV
jgi:cell division septum initiation protein DivIVA